MRRYMEHTYIIISSTRPAKWKRWVKRMEDLGVEHGARGWWLFSPIFPKGFLWSYLNVCIDEDIPFFLQNFRVQGMPSCPGGSLPSAREPKLHSFGRGIAQGQGSKSIVHKCITTDCRRKMFNVCVHACMCMHV